MKSKTKQQLEKMKQYVTDKDTDLELCDLYYVHGFIDALYYEGIITSKRRLELTIEYGNIFTESHYN